MSFAELSNFTSQLRLHQKNQNLGKKEAIGFVGVASVSGLCIAMLMSPTALLPVAGFFTAVVAKGFIKSQMQSVKTWHERDIKELNLKKEERLGSNPFASLVDIEAEVKKCTTDAEEIKAVYQRKVILLAIAFFVTQIAVVVLVPYRGLLLHTHEGFNRIPQIAHFLKAHYVELINFTIAPSLACKVLSIALWAHKNGSKPTPKRLLAPKPAPKPRVVEPCHITNEGHLTLLAERYRQPSIAKQFTQAIKLLQEQQWRARPPLISSSILLPLAGIKPHRPFTYSSYL